MTLDTKNIINLDLKKDQKILNFSDFQKQSIKFDNFLFDICVIDIQCMYLIFLIGNVVHNRPLT